MRCNVKLGRERPEGIHRVLLEAVLPKLFSRDWHVATLVGHLPKVLMRINSSWLSKDLRKIILAQHRPFPIQVRVSTKVVCDNWMRESGRVIEAAGSALPRKPPHREE
jgi:hypothetical protein